MYDYFRRLARTGAAYQVGEALAKGVARRPAARLHAPSDARPTTARRTCSLDPVILVSIVIRLGLVEAFVRFYFDDADPERRATAGPRRDRPACWASPPCVAIVVRRARGAAVRAHPRLPRHHADAHHGPGPVVVHEPGDGLRAAARGRAGGDVPARLAGQRRPDHRAVRLPGRHPRRGRARPAGRQLRRLDCGAARPARRPAHRIGMPRRIDRERLARCCASACRRCRPRSRCSR